MALNFFKKVKTLRHPHTLKFIDGIESKDLLIIVTDRVIPLKQYIKNDLSKEKKSSTKNMVVAWGSHCILKALEFINKDCKLLHGAVCSDSIFVTQSGDFKLGGFFVTDELNSYNKSPSELFTLNPEVIEKVYQSPERRRSEFSVIYQKKEATDIYGFGCILLECFGEAISDSFSTAKLPPLLRKIFAEITNAESSSRPTPTEVYSSSGFKRAFNNKYVKALMFLEEIQIKNEIEKLDFLKKLENDVDDFPSSSSLHKFLPALTELQNFQNNSGNANAEGAFDVSHSALILKIVVKITRKTEDEVNKKLLLLPLITSMFNCNDRQTRIILLQNLSLYAEFLQSKQLNKEIFPKVVAGFSDSTVALREITLKSMVLLAPRLTPTNLNDVLVKAMFRLLDDKEPSLVTNTVVCFSKLLTDFDEKTRGKVVAAVFPKVLKSPHQHTRLAALRGISSAVRDLLEGNDEGSVSDKKLTNAKLCVSKLLPALGFSLLDSNSEVRTEAFKTFHYILKQLKTVSKQLDVKIDNNGSGMKDNLGASQAGGYLTAATTWASSTLNRNYSDSSPKVDVPAQKVSSTVRKVVKQDINDESSQHSEDKSQHQNWGESSEDEDLFAADDDDKDVKPKAKKTIFGNGFELDQKKSDSVTRLRKTATSNSAINGKNASEVAQDLLDEDDFFKNF